MSTVTKSKRAARSGAVKTIAPPLVDPRSSIAFAQIAYGLWRYETEAHRMEIRLIRAIDHGHNSYEGLLTLRPTGFIATRVNHREFREVQVQLIDAYLDLARRDEPLRQLLRFEDWRDVPDVIAKLERRRDAYAKRFALKVRSSKISTGSVNNRETVILTAATETLPREVPA